MDYNREYDTTQVDTPENRRGMVRLLQKYAKYSDDGGSPVFDDPEGTGDLVVTIYLRLLGDYADRRSDRPESLEKALEDWENNKESDTYFAALFDHLRYIELAYLSEDPSDPAWPSVFKVNIAGEDVAALTVFSSTEQIPEGVTDTLYVHKASIYDLLYACGTDGVTDILINPQSTTGSFDAENMKACIEQYDTVDRFWEGMRSDGVYGEDLFPLLLQSFLYRNVRCVHGTEERNQEEVGRCIPYTEGRKAPVIYVDTAGGRMARIPVDEILFIQEIVAGDDGTAAAAEPVRGR